MSLNIVVPVPPFGIREDVLANVGDRAPQHSHVFPHVTIVYRGAILVKQFAADGTVAREQVVYGGTNRPFILIPAGVEHELIAVRPDSAYGCWFLCREPAEGEAIVHWDGWMGAFGG